MKWISTAIAAVALLAFSTSAFAEDKEITLKGEAKCAKCALKQSDKCQTVIQAEKNGKTVTYYLTSNDTAKGFHKNVCSDTKKVTAKGTVKEEDGKKMLTVSKIEVDKE